MPGATDWAAREAVLLEKLVQKVKADPQFDAEEVATLRRVIAARRAWEILGGGMRLFVTGLVLVAAGIAAWEAVAARIRQWLAGH